MEHQIVINKNSFPAHSEEEAVLYFDDALQGVLALNTGADLFTFYLDSNDVLLADFNLAEDFTYSDFVEQITDHDLELFLLEVEDKSPAVDALSDEQIYEMAQYEFYIVDEAIVDFPDLLNMSWVLSATLLSMPTNALWESSRLNIARTECGRFIDEKLWLNNICFESHGVEISEQYGEVALADICGEHHITDALNEWYSEQASENRRRIIDKLKLACERNFQGAKPLFDTLTNAGGIREIRFSAYSGGAIRILFKASADGKQAILVGFIKKSNDEGYATEIDKAKDLYKAIA
jgi:hypothetical protein